MQKKNNKNKNNKKRNLVREFLFHLKLRNWLWKTVFQEKNYNKLMDPEMMIELLPRMWRRFCEVCK